MPETLKPCCRKALTETTRRYEDLTTSYPVIKDFPCPTCSEVLKLRIYGPPEEEQDVSRVE